MSQQNSQKEEGEVCCIATHANELPLYVTCQACKAQYPDITGSGEQGDGCCAWIEKCEFGDASGVEWHMDWRQLGYVPNEQTKMEMDHTWQQYKDECAKVRDHYKDRAIYSLHASWGSTFDNESKAFAFVDEQGMKNTKWMDLVENIDNNNMLCDACIYEALATGYIRHGSEFESSQLMTSRELRLYKPHCVRNTCITQTH